VEESGEVCSYEPIEALRGEFWTAVGLGEADFLLKFA
jgi:hypothetical protein